MRRLRGTAVLLAIVAGAVTACTDEHPEVEKPASGSTAPQAEDQQTGSSRPGRRP